MIFGKDKMKPMSETEKKAKMTALQDAHKLASDMMKEGLGSSKGMKKVTVASDSPEGLKEGLMKAEEMLGQHDEDDMELGHNEEETQDEMEAGQDESEPMDEHELDAEIERLMKMKEKLAR